MYYIAQTQTARIAKTTQPPTEAIHAANAAHQQGQRKRTNKKWKDNSICNHAPQAQMLFYACGVFTKAVRVMDKKKNIGFTRIYSYPSLAAYAVGIFVLAVASLIDDSIDLVRISTAIGSGGFLVILGEILISQHQLSIRLGKIYEDLLTDYTIWRDTVAVNNATLQKWLAKTEKYARENKEKHKGNAAKEIIFSCIGIVAIVAGFSLVWLILASSNFYGFIRPYQPLIAALSFFLLTVAMILKERGEKSISEARQNREEAVRVIEILLGIENDLLEGREDYDV